MAQSKFMLYKYVKLDDGAWRNKSVPGHVWELDRGQLRYGLIVMQA